MRLSLCLVGAFLLVLLAPPTSGRAQSPVSTDPFFLYYGFVAPQQNQQALQQFNAALQNQQSANSFAQQRFQGRTEDRIAQALEELSQPPGARRVGRPSAGFDNTEGYFPRRLQGRQATGGAGGRSGRSFGGRR